MALRNQHCVSSIQLTRYLILRTTTQFLRQANFASDQCIQFFKCHSFKNILHIPPFMLPYKAVIPNNRFYHYNKHWIFKCQMTTSKNKLQTATIAMGIYCLLYALLRALSAVAPVPFCLLNMCSVWFLWPCALPTSRIGLEWNSRLQRY